MAEDWRRYLDQAPEQRGVRLIKWARTFTDEWIDIKRAGAQLLEGTFNGEARILQVAPDVDEEHVWATIESGGQVQEVCLGQDLLLNGAIKGRLRLNDAGPAGAQAAATGTRRTTMPARDVAKEAFNKEQLEQSRLRLQRGEPNAYDIVRVLADVPVGYYLLHEIHAAICGWTQDASNGRFFLGDLPLYPGLCPKAQDAVDALNACETLGERRETYHALPEAQREELMRNFGAKTPTFHLANRRRTNFGSTLREAHVVTNDAKFDGPHRVRVFDGDTANWPAAARAWRAGLPQYGGRNATVYGVEKLR